MAPPDPNPEAIDIEQDDRAVWLKDLASQRAHIHANYPMGKEQVTDSTFVTVHKDVKHQKLFSTADSTWRRKNLDTLVAKEIEEADQAGADGCDRSPPPRSLVERHDRQPTLSLDARTHRQQAPLPLTA
jgi:hypothetical protein